MADDVDHRPMTKPKKAPVIELAKVTWGCFACGHRNLNISDKRHCARCGEAKPRPAQQ